MVPQGRLGLHRRADGFLIGRLGPIASFLTGVREVSIVDDGRLRVAGLMVYPVLGLGLLAAAEQLREDHVCLSDYVAVVKALTAFSDRQPQGLSKVVR